jgi:hypothetical protein
VLDITINPLVPESCHSYTGAGDGQLRAGSSRQLTSAIWRLAGHLPSGPLPTTTYRVFCMPLATSGASLVTSLTKDIFLVVEFGSVSLYTSLSGQQRLLKCASHHK